jgi:hypothetical protein
MLVFLQPCMARHTQWASQPQPGAVETAPAPPVVGSDLHAPRLWPSAQGQL